MKKGTLIVSAVAVAACLQVPSGCLAGEQLGATPAVDAQATTAAPYIITRICLRGARKSGGSGEGLWKVDLTEGQKSGHEAVAARSDAIEPGAGDLGDEAVGTKLGDEPGGTLAAPERQQW
jgi:hypothetical protein